MRFALQQLCLLTALLQCSGTKDSVNVVIVGAGVSGLAAGRYLVSLNKKYNLTILEARSRIGGRVWTNLDAFQGAVGGDADCGASWIHGGDPGNPIRDFADKFQIDTKPTDYEDILMKRNGATVSDHTLSVAVDIYGNMTDDLDNSDYGDISVRAAFVKLGYGDEMKDPLINWFLADREADEGASIDKISSASDDYLYLDGEDRVFPKGYGQVPQSIQRGSAGQQPLSVLYGQVVQRVAVSNGSATVYTQSSQYQADHVIVTLPLGVLKNGDVTFDPPLSATKQKAISKIGFGLLNKVILKFSSVFWDKKRPFFGYVPEDINQRGYLTSWMNGYYVGGTPTLIGFISGDNAISAESISDADLRADAIAIIRKMLSSSAPDPIGFFRTRWLADPFARGSYSYQAVGSSASNRRALSHPEPPLHFAGEHTNSSFFSTVHGAYMSGIRVAKEIDV